MTCRARLRSTRGPARHEGGFPSGSRDGPDLCLRAIDSFSKAGSFGMRTQFGRCAAPGADD